MAEAEQSQIAIDATWLIRRAFYALGKEQDPGKTIISVMQSVLKYIRTTEYKSKVIMLHDKGTWRYRPKDKNVDYKSTREYDESYQACWDAANAIHEMFPKIGIQSIKVGGIEADDLGYWYANQGIKTMLVSKDYDWLISCNEDTSVLMPKTGTQVERFWTAEDVVNKFELDNVSDYLLYKAIDGDGSDNISGVPLGGNTVQQVMKYFREDACPDEVMFKIKANIELMRLDRIMTDKDVIKGIKEQELVIEYPVRATRVMMPFCTGLEIPPYMNGVLDKYIRLHKPSV